MINKKLRGCYILIAVGAVLFVAGLVLMIRFAESEGIMKTLPFACVGIGAGLFGGSLGSAIRYRRMAKDPGLVKTSEIDAKDERNIAISNKAKATAYNCAMVIYSVLLMFLAVVQVELYVTLVFVGAYLFVIFLHTYYLSKYSKEM